MQRKNVIVMLMGCEEPIVRGWFTFRIENKCVRLFKVTVDIRFGGGIKPEARNSMVYVPRQTFLIEHNGSDISDVAVFKHTTTDTKHHS